MTPKRNKGIRQPRIGGYIAATLAGWAKSIGIDAETINKALKRNDKDFKPGELIPARAVYDALTVGNQLKVAKLRRENAEAEKVERENLVEDGKLIDLAQAEKKLWDELLLPVKVEIEAMPDRMAPLMTGVPETDHEHLTNWKEALKRQIGER